MPILQNPYTGTILTFNTPAGGMKAGGAFDPASDYAPNGNWAFSGSVGLAPGSLLQESFADGLTAHAGGGQSAALALTSEVNRLATVATVADSVMLPTSQAGLTVYVINHGAQACQVFGAGTDTIDDIATATGVSQMAGSSVLYFCITPGKWYTEGLSTGYSTSLGMQTLSYENGITAHAGGGQASGYPITKLMSRVTIVATAADSVTLPVSQPGLQLTISNSAAANSMNVFPNAGGTGSEAINALGANAAFAFAASTTPITFYCWVAGLWLTK